MELDDLLEMSIEDFGDVEKIVNVLICNCVEAYKMNELSWQLYLLLEKHEKMLREKDGFQVKVIRTCYNALLDSLEMNLSRITEKENSHNKKDFNMSTLKYKIEKSRMDTDEKKKILQLFDDLEKDSNLKETLDAMRIERNKFIAHLDKDYLSGSKINGKKLNFLGITIVIEKIESILKEVSCVCGICCKEFFLDEEEKQKFKESIINITGGYLKDA